MALISLPQLHVESVVRNAEKRYAMSSEALLDEQEMYSDDYVFDVFLSHSYRDAELDRETLVSLRDRLTRFRLDVYVDWIIDRQLNRAHVSARTAAKLRNRMDHSRCLFFATSANSQNSRWMPWELGYMDGMCGLVAILPLAHRSNQLDFKGQEYLGIYPYLDEAQMSGTDRTYLWVNKNPTTYVTLRDWLRGHKPVVHQH